MVAVGLLPSPQALSFRDCLLQPSRFPPAKWLTFTLLGLLLLLNPSFLAGQSTLDKATEERIQRGIHFIYDIEFEKADQEFKHVIDAYPVHPVGYFFTAMTQWWRILTKLDDESRDDRLRDMLELVIELCEKRLEKDKTDITAMFFKGGAIGFRGRLRANRGNWLGAANDGMAALPIVRRAYELDPKNDDVLLGVGIYDYYAAVIPKQYPLVRPALMFLPPGDKKKGLEELKKAALSGKYAHTEATYFLMQAYYQYEKDYAAAVEYAKELHTLYPRNPLFQRYLGRCYVRLGYWVEAVKEFSEVRDRYLAGQVGYDAQEAREAYYYIGRFHFMAGEYDQALESFYRCDELSRKMDKDGASGFMSMTNLTIGMIYDAQQKRSLAIEQYRKVMKMKEYENTHKDALRFLTSPYSRD